jgi:hypothetical protein
MHKVTMENVYEVKQIKLQILTDCGEKQANLDGRRSSLLI